MFTVKVFYLADIINFHLFPATIIPVHTEKYNHQIIIGQPMTNFYQKKSYISAVRLTKFPTYGEVSSLPGVVPRHVL